MSDLTERIQLTRKERELILKHGYPFERLEKALRRWPKDQMIRTISMSEYELSMLIGALSRSLNPAEHCDERHCGECRNKKLWFWNNGNAIHRRTEKTS